ncbi:MAG: VWA domain-containing protein [Planctomycetota bacterium]|jgi:hypothetical protein
MRVGLLLLFACAAYAQPRPPEEIAKSKYRQYMEWKKDGTHTRGRLDILRSMGRLDTPTARSSLLKILRKTNSDDERIVAILALGRIADLDTTIKLLAVVAKKPWPERVEALADALAQVTNKKARDWLANGALRERDERILYAVAMAQTGLADPAAAPHLVQVYANAKGVDTQYAAIRGLAALDAPGVKEVLDKAAQHEDWRVRLAVAHAPTHAVGRLDDSTASVRQAAAATCRELKIEAAIEPLIRLVEADPRLRTRYDASKALQAISGRDLGLDPMAWRRWWKQKEGEVKPGKITVARYYNFGVYSDRVLFVVDVSGSMNWSFHFKPKRIEVARSQLDRVLHAIDKKALVNLMVFSDKVRLWQKREVEANEKNIARATQWAKKMLAKPEGDTRTFWALARAFDRNPEFDTIYFLTDGYPTDGKYVAPEGIVYSVRAWNRFRGARIHTIALTLENVDRGHPNESTKSLRRMKEFMRDLARYTGGETTVVTRAPPN